MTASPTGSVRRDRLPTGAAIGIAALVALAFAALVPALAVGLAVVGVVAVAAAPAGSAWRWAGAAVVPVALMLAWGGTVDEWLSSGARSCADPTSSLAVSRVLEASFVLLAVALLARRIGSDAGGLGLRRPSRTEAWIAVAVVATVPLASLAIGPILAEPFFGPIRLELAAWAFLPALAVAVANGTMEEVAYRGALLRWDARLTGFGIALVGQAIIFGLAHLGDDFVGSPLPVLAFVALGGLAAGVVARWTGSLFLPIVVHVCIDVPLYFALACRGG